jgi:hypothetical protein
MMFARYSHWIANLLFAIIITFMLRKRADVFIYVGLLAIVQPVFGGLFYLMTITLNKHRS